MSDVIVERLKADYAIMHIRCHGLITRLVGLGDFSNLRLASTLLRVMIDATACIEKLRLDYDRRTDARLTGIMVILPRLVSGIDTAIGDDGKMVADEDVAYLLAELQHYTHY